MLNKSLTDGCFSPDFKTAAVVRPLLKKAGSDTNQIKNFRPVSNVMSLIISKLLDRIVQR